jgi:stage II sporulation protein E
MAIIICDVVLGLYFNAYGDYNYKILCSTILGELLFLCFSNKTISLLKTVFGDKNGTLALRNMVNRSRDALCKRMYSLSEVFAEMNRTFKETIKGVLPASEAKQMLKEELFQKVCADCPEKHRCHRVMAKETDETLDGIISAGLDRGKVTILDIPPFLSTRCNRTTTILNCVNNLIGSYKQYTYCVSNVDTSKALIAEEFSGVSKLLLTLASETKDLVTFNEELENKIIEELNYVNVLATEVYVYQKEEKMVSCTITLRSSDLSSPKLFEVLKRNFGTKMAVVSSESAVVPNYVVANFSPAPKYDCIFGSSGTPKYGNTVSGDSYTFARLNGNKILLAVCDGMGSGEQAQKTSDTAISLIENFYKADFDDEIILSSVNKLLSMQMTENYSALDVCVIDLKNALGDFVKVGSPACFVKHANSTETVEGSGALPIGILEDIKPSISKKMFEPNDLIVLCSDGIADAFGDAGTLCDYINNTQTLNPQELSNIILQKAEELSDDIPQDDMTVLCTRIFVNV